MPQADFLDTGWKPLPNGRWICIACIDPKPGDLRAALRHETTEKHTHSVAARLRKESESAHPSPGSSSLAAQRSLPVLRDFLADMAGPEPQADSLEDDSSSFNFNDSSFLSNIGVSKVSLSEALLGFLEDHEYSESESEKDSEDEQEQVETREMEAESGMPFSLIILL